MGRGRRRRRRRAGLPCSRREPRPQRCGGVHRSRSGRSGRAPHLPAGRRPVPGTRGRVLSRWHRAVARGRIRRDHADRAGARRRRDPAARAGPPSPHGCRSHGSGGDHTARFAAGAGAAGGRGRRRAGARVPGRALGAAGTRPGGRAGRGAEGPGHPRAGPGGATAPSARRRRVARGRWRPLGLDRSLRAPARAGRREESRRALLRRYGAGAGAHAAGRASLRRVSAARAGGRARHLLLVRAAVAVGGKRSAVRPAAPRSPRPSGHPGARRAHRGLGAGAAGAHRHPRPALGAGAWGRVVYGVVTDGFAYSDLATPLHDVVGAEGDPAKAAASPTVRQEIRLWTAAVLRQTPEEPLQPVPLGEVHVASDVDVAQALRMDAYLGGAQPTAIPVGLYTSGGLEAPVYVDADFLLGPEAAHLNISGVSGLATKTSAVEFLLASIFQHFPPHKGRVAAVCFNVKGPDLCFLDRPGTLDDEDRRRYERLGVAPEPFRRVRYYAPFKADGVNLNTLRTHPDLAGDAEPLLWGLREVLDYAEVLLNRDDIDAKADAFIDFLADRVVDKEFEDGFGGVHRVVTFADLERLFRSIFDGLELASRGGDSWRTHHIATMRKVRNRLANISTRCKGLVTDDGPSNDLPWGRFDDRTVYVVDVANVDPLGQEPVFARVVSQLRERLERRDLGVDAVVVFVDELNKYAPADGPETYVKKMLLDISERGRYLGLVLFGAEQFRSQVHRRVVGNAGTMVFGRMDSDELATPGYQVLSPATKIKLATLPIGELMVRHPHFTQPIFVRFPRPVVLRGRDGVERFPPATDLPFEDAVVRQLVKLDARVRPNPVKDLIADRREEDVRRALALTRQSRPQDAFAHFKRLLGGRVAAAPLPVRESVPPLNPISDEPY